MTHFYERNITEIKKEYTVFMTNVLSPLIYEGIKNLYTAAKDLDDKFETAKLQKPDIQNPGVFKLFQKLLANIPNLNNHKIENETIRIRDNSKIADIFDDLIRAVVKSNIVLLTYNASSKTCMLVKEKYHDNIDINDFIHKCYIECAKSFYNYPELFYHKYSTLDIQRNKRESIGIIKNAINEAVRKIIPMKLVLEEYLSNDYVKDDKDIENDISNSDYSNIKNMLGRELKENENRRILVDSHELSRSSNENYGSDDSGNSSGNDSDNDSGDDSDSDSDSESDNNNDRDKNHSVENAIELEKMILDTKDTENVHNNTKHEDMGTNVEKDTREDSKNDNIDMPKHVVAPVHIPKTRDININYNTGNRRSATSKMFEHAISTLKNNEAPRVGINNTSNNNEVQRADTNNTFINKDDNIINISRDGKLANQHIRPAVMDL